MCKVCLNDWKTHTNYQIILLKMQNKSHQLVYLVHHAFFHKISTNTFNPTTTFIRNTRVLTYIEHSIVVCSFQTISLWAWKVSAIFVNDTAARASPDQPCCHDRIVQFTRYSNLRVTTIVIFGELRTISNSLGWVAILLLLNLVFAYLSMHLLLLFCTFMIKICPFTLMRESRVATAYLLKVSKS